MPSILTPLDLRGARGDLRRLLPAPDLGGEGALEPVREILAEVRTRGDEALLELTERFDGVRLEHLRVAQAEMRAALGAIPRPLREAMEVAHDAIDSFHRAELGGEVRHERDGVVVRELRRPVGRAGLYAPGGRAPLASSVLMTAVPARVAGVAEVVVCSPPGPDGGLAPSVLAAAAIAEVDEVYRVGGAQAIGALAYGTETIRAVDVVAGPGNRYVATAERLVAAEGAVGVPSGFSGPSEVAVVADETTPAGWAAIDLVVQAEHGPDGLAYLITWSEAVAGAVTEATAAIVASSPRRAEIESTLRRGGYSVLVDGPEQAIAAANAIAPEHLELLCEDPETLVPLVESAGAVFCGPWAPASVGDYIAGPSHVLPTARSARFASALSVADFCKRVHVVALDERALRRVAPHIEAMAESEGLAAHAASVRLRTEAT